MSKESYKKSEKSEGYKSILKDLDKYEKVANLRNLKKGIKYAEQEGGYIDPNFESDIPIDDKYHQGKVAGYAKRLLNGGNIEGAIKILANRKLLNNKSMQQYLKRGIQKESERGMLRKDRIEVIREMIEGYEKSNN